LKKGKTVNGPLAEQKNSPHDLKIQALGTSFSITAGEDPAYLNDVLAQYQAAVANTQAISGMKDPLKVAILTGFLLCDAINKLKRQIDNEQTNAEQELDRITQNLIDYIDQAMEESNPFNA
jgi:cell division protein ZapA (FtsZ GTPase activity inhibitor)